MEYNVKIMNKESSDYGYGYMDGRIDSLAQVKKLTEELKTKSARIMRLETEITDLKNANYLLTLAVKKKIKAKQTKRGKK